MGSTATTPRTSLAIGSTGNPLDTWAGKNGTYHRRYYYYYYYALCSMLYACCKMRLLDNVRYAKQINKCDQISKCTASSRHLKAAYGSC
jgi:hypothetical protein